MALIYTDNSLKNYLINGGLEIWQRGTSFASTATVIYGPDRWFLGRDLFASGLTVSQQSSAAPASTSTLCARVQRDSGNSGTGRNYLLQLLETQDVKDLAGKAVNLSFRMRRGANYSSTSNLVTVRIVNGTGSQQSANTVFNAGFTGHNVILSQTMTIASTSSFDRYTVNCTIPSNATQLYIEFSYAPTGTAGAADYFEVTEVMLNEGLDFSIFRRAGGSYGGEIRECQRFFAKTFPLGTTPGALNDALVGGRTIGTAANALVGNWKFPVAMRATPTITFYNAITGATGSWRNNVTDYPMGTNALGVGLDQTGFNNTGATTDGLVLAGHITANAEI